MKASGRQTKHLPAEKATGRQKNSWQSEEQLAGRRTADKQKNSWQAEEQLTSKKTATSRKTADKQRKVCKQKTADNQKNSYQQKTADKQKNSWQAEKAVLLYKLYKTANNRTIARYRESEQRRNSWEGSHNNRHHELTTNWIIFRQKEKEGRKWGERESER